MSKIDTEGAYKGTVSEAAVGQTKRGFPQYIVRLDATQKWVESPAEMEHYSIEEPGWVDWSEYGESITAFLVLCNDEKRLLNYEQVMTAFGWDGTSFSGLAGLDVEGREILFRVEENDYEGNVSMQVNWVDDKDAPVQRELSSLDESKLTDLDSKFGSMMETGKKEKPKAAAAGKGKGKGSTTKGKDKPASGKQGKATTKSKTTKAGPPSSKPPAAEPESEETEEAPFDAGSAFADMPEDAEEAQIKVWTIVSENKGSNSDAEIGDAWVEACREVGGDREESDFTVSDWVAIGTKVISGLELQVA